MKVIKLSHFAKAQLLNEQPIKAHHNPKLPGKKIDFKNKKSIGK